MYSFLIISLSFRENIQFITIVVSLKRSDNALEQ